METKYLKLVRTKVKKGSAPDSIKVINFDQDKPRIPFSELRELMFVLKPSNVPVRRLRRAKNNSLHNNMLIKK
jgi:hypothetical protein